MNDIILFSFGYSLTPEFVPYLLVSLKRHQPSENPTKAPPKSRFWKRLANDFYRNCHSVTHIISQVPPNWPKYLEKTLSTGYSSYFRHIIQKLMRRYPHKSTQFFKLPRPPEDDGRPRTNLIFGMANHDTKLWVLTFLAPNTSTLHAALHS